MPTGGPGGRLGRECAQQVRSPECHRLRDQEFAAAVEDTEGPVTAGPRTNGQRAGPCTVEALERCLTQRKSREVGPAAQEPRIETVHVGRQPIVDRTGELYGYELLFRDQASAGSAIHDGDSATTATITAAFSEFGADVLLGGRR